MERISSRQNPIVQQFRALAEARGDRLLLDGAHLLEEALAAGLAVEVVALGDRAANPDAEDLVRRAEQQGARILGVTDAVLAAISPVRQPSGLVAIACARPATLEAALDHPPQLVLLLADVQDPGNVGAIIRTADACGATGVIAGGATADPFGWKALRGSMGSAFRLPVATRQPLDRAAAAARHAGLRLFAAVPHDGTPLPRCNLRDPSAIVFGREGAGLSGHAIASADQRLTIPMRSAVDSLNVAVAAGLVVYEAQRQRQERLP